MEPGNIEYLGPFIGEWTLEADIPGMPPTNDSARTTFEWLPGRRFLVQRWEVPHPEAPDGIALIGFDATRETLLQHYFDSRGVARVYEMRFEEGVWQLSRTTPDFSPLNFSQRFTGTFSDDGDTITGQWEISHDHSTWERDFGLTYVRVPPSGGS